jgi:hypothetical protein
MQPNHTVNRNRSKRGGFLGLSQRRSLYAVTRFRAFILHLIANAGIILALLGLMHWVWYPAPYFEINGGWQVWRILAGFISISPWLQDYPQKPQ